MPPSRSPLCQVVNVADMENDNKRQIRTSYETEVVNLMALGQSDFLRENAQCLFLCHFEDPVLVLIVSVDRAIEILNHDTSDMNAGQEQLNKPIELQATPDDDQSFKPLGEYDSSSLSEAVSESELDDISGIEDISSTGCVASEASEETVVGKRFKATDDNRSVASAPSEASDQLWNVEMSRKMELKARHSSAPERKMDKDGHFWQYTGLSPTGRRVYRTWAELGWAEEDYHPVPPRKILDGHFS